MAIVKSDIAGSVWKIEVELGQALAAGEVALILESMKMEIPVEVPISGRVAQIFVVEGEAIGEDAPLIRLEAD
jgi:biotin carboxyl carrier protein